MPTLRSLDLDRDAPRRRPDAVAAGEQRWRQLLFVHWSFPADEVRPLVPQGLELDTWDGRAWVGLVPFAMEGIRSSWMPRIAALDFLETNVRTYVHHRGEPGVWFFSLEASSRLAVRVARLAWGLPYYLAQMTSERDGDRIRYRSTRRRSASSRPGSDRPEVSVSFRIGEELGPSSHGSFEFFLLERYLLFSQQRGRLRKGQVHHAPYPARRATIESLDETLLRAAGLERGGRTAEAVHYSEGVDVEVFALRP